MKKRKGNDAQRPGVYSPMHSHTATLAHAPPQAVHSEARPLVSVETAESAFEHFYRHNWGSVARALAIALADKELAIEATDEAMARAYPRWDKLRTYDNPAAWVYRVGLNWARSHFRRISRRLPLRRQPVVEAPEVTDPAINEALLGLPVEQRSVVVCRLLLDWSVADTAIALGVRPGTVQSRLHRALRSLQNSLYHLR